MNMDVARAIMLPGIMNARPTLSTIMMSVPTLLALSDGKGSSDALVLTRLIWDHRSKPAVVPIVWKMALRVDMAAASNTSMKMITNRSGIAELMNSGIMLSTLPLAAVMAITPSFSKKYTFVSGPTVYTMPVVSRMKRPPMGTARLRALLSLAVMKRTTSCGCARTPIPTPIMMVVTRTYHISDPNVGSAVQLNIPLLDRPAGICGDRSLSFVNAVAGSPRRENVRKRRTTIPTSMMMPCMASVYMTAMRPPAIT